MNERYHIRLELRQIRGSSRFGGLCALLEGTFEFGRDAFAGIREVILFVGRFLSRDFDLIKHYLKIDYRIMQKYSGIINLDSFKHIDTYIL